MPCHFFSKMQLGCCSTRHSHRTSLLRCCRRHHSPPMTKALGTLTQCISPSLHICNTIAVILYTPLRTVKVPHSPTCPLSLPVPYAVHKTLVMLLCGVQKKGKRGACFVLTCCSAAPALLLLSQKHTWLSAADAECAERRTTAHNTAALCRVQTVCQSHTTSRLQG